jgi:hypothetical protein
MAPFFMGRVFAMKQAGTKLQQPMRRTRAKHKAAKPARLQKPIELYYRGGVRSRQ